MVKTLQRILFLYALFIGCQTVSRASGISFIQNKGQWQADVLFRADIPGGFLFLKKQSLVYVFYDAKAVSDRHHFKSDSQARSTFRPEEPISAHGVEVFFENSQSNVNQVPSKPSATHYAFFLGENQDKWAGDVQGFEEVLYPELYKGIDLRVFMYRSTLKYEFIVHPEGDPATIALRYEGASGLSVNSEGQSVIKTTRNEFKEAPPYSFQVAGGKTTEVDCHFVLKDQNRVHFALPKGYDRKKTLTIDPELVFSTYSGSLSDNWGHTATYDAAGNLYSGGTVFGKDFPVTTGAFQVAFGSLVDVSIMKFSPAGNQLLYAAFLGGAESDVPASMVVNSKNELLIYGMTSSKNFPVKNGFQSTFGGGTAEVPMSGVPMNNGSDMFVARIAADGRQLLSATYLGGEGNDGISTTDRVVIANYGDCFRGEIAVDVMDNVWVASSTNSTKFPLKNPVKSSLGGRQDGVVFRLSPTLSDLQWSTYAGGNEFDALFSIKPTASGDVFVTGITQSTDLTITADAYQKTLGGTEDALVLKFANDRLAKATYMGTSAQDGAYLLDLDQAGNVYVYGSTRGQYPVSAGVYSNAKSGQFIHALDGNLSKTVFSTVVGSGRGTPDISPTAFLVSECGNIYLAGWGGEVNTYNHFNDASSTTGLPVTTDALQRTTTGNNFYIAILEQGAKSLLYATYFGNMNRSQRAQGDHVDGGTSRFDKNGMIYHATCACGDSGFPVSPQAWSSTNKSDNCNSVAFKIDIDRLKADFDVYEGQTKDVMKGCAPLSLSFANTSEGGLEYLWQINGSTISRDATEAAHVFSTPGTYTVTLKAYNRLSCKREDIATKTIVVETLNAAVKADTTVCENTLLKLWATGGTQYQWTPAAGLDNPQSASPNVTVKESTVFSVVISNGVGCKVTKTVRINVDKKSDFAAMPDTEVCQGQSTLLTVTGSASQYTWSGPGLSATTGNSVTVKPTQTSTYTVEGVYGAGCKPLRQVTVKVDDTFAPSFDIVRLEGACNEPIRYTMANKTRNAARYVWDMGTGNTLNQDGVEGYSYEQAGEYTVTLTSYNAAGCSLSVSRTLVAEPVFELANVITPNGDGKNDLFVVPIDGARLEMYNRWGKKIFAADDYKNNWGKGIANGTYYYVVDTPAGNHCKGWLEVLE